MINVGPSGSIFDLNSKGLGELCADYVQDRGNTALQTRIIAVYSECQGELPDALVTDLDTLRLSIAYADPSDPVLRLANYAVGVHLLKKLPRPLKGAVTSYLGAQMLTDADVLGGLLFRDSTRKHAERIIKEEVEHGGPLNYRNLRRAAIALVACGFDELTVGRKKNIRCLLLKALAKRILRPGLEKGQVVGPSAKRQQVSPIELEFRRAAQLILSKLDESRPPSDLEDYVGYHGAALDRAQEMLESHLEKMGNFKIGLQGFVFTYCEDKLEKGTFLIRKSSTRPTQDSNGLSEQVYVISLRRHSGKIVHGRIHLTQDSEGGAEWIWEAGKSTQDKVYKSLAELLDGSKRILNRYRPVCRPSSVEIEQYMSAFIDESSEWSDSSD